MDEQILRGRISGWTRVVIAFHGDLCIASTGAVTPNRDLAGNQLQDLTASVSPQGLMFGIVATPGSGGAAVFTWRTDDSAPRRFVESLIQVGNLENNLASLVAQFVFFHLENTYFSEAWWNALSEKNRTHLESLAAIGFPYATPFRYSSAQLVPWEIDSVNTEIE